MGCGYIKKERNSRTLLDEIVGTRRSVVEDIRHGNCGVIARNALGRISGAVDRIKGLGNGSQEFSKFVGYGNHFVVLVNTGDGSFFTVDFALSNELNKELLLKFNQDYFSILSIRTNSIDEALVTMSSLYGGDWTLDNTRKRNVID